MTSSTKYAKTEAHKRLGCETEKPKKQIDTYRKLFACDSQKPRFYKGAILKNLVSTYIRVRLSFLMPSEAIRRRDVSSSSAHLHARADSKGVKAVEQLGDAAPLKGPKRCVALFGKAFCGDVDA